MSEDDRVEYFEWGYRLPDGVERWEQDYGTDGSWIGHDSERGIPVIDIYDDTTAEKIRAVLSKAGVDGEVLRRKVTVTRGPVEEVNRGVE